jgi:hypothetical protein
MPKLRQALYVGRKFKTDQTNMKAFMIITILLLINFTSFAQLEITGGYSDYFGNYVKLDSSNTFEYSWHGGMSSSWTVGTWTRNGDTIFFHKSFIYDTIRLSNTDGSFKDRLVLSENRTTERVSSFNMSPDQNRIASPDKLFFKKGRLYKIQDGKLLKRKQTRWNKKYDPWYIKLQD